jgi:hypothetical protein
MPWKTNGKDGDNLLKIFKSKDIDLNNTTAKYINSIKEKYSQEFSQFTRPVFIGHYRSILSAFKTGEALTGARKPAECKCFLQFMCTSCVNHI